MDVLNVVAIFAVILLHVSLNIFGNAGDAAWNVALVYQCVAIFAVPVFFMVSGANLLGYRARYDTATFFKKRALRVVVTLVVWSAVIYLLLCFASPAFGYEPRNFGVVEFVKELLTDRIISIYWFFYVIIGLYVMTPIFSLIAANRCVLGYAIILGAVVTFVVPTAQAYAPVNYVVDPYSLGFFTWSATYYLLGYYLTHYFDRKIPTWVLVAACAVSVVAMIGLTLVQNAAHVPDAYSNLWAKAEGIPTLVYAPALFLLFKGAEGRISAAKGYPVWKKLSALSLTVYAVHMPLIWAFETNLPGGILMRFVVEPIAVYAVSLGIAWVMQTAKTAIKAKARKAN